MIFELSVLVLLPDKYSPPLEILEWRMNGDDMCPSCGEMSQAKALISGGNDTSASQWPWHVSLWKRTSSTQINYICGELSFYLNSNLKLYEICSSGGSIVNKKWIVSAGKETHKPFYSSFQPFPAHCMFNSGQIVSENVLKIRIGTEASLSSFNKQYSVSTVIVHEDYSKEKFENDIALLKFKESLILSQNFRSICFSQLGSLPQASRGIAVGYGSTDKQNYHSDVLKQAEMPIVEQEDCLDSDPSFFRTFLFPGNFCAGEIGVTRGVCSGDSVKFVVVISLSKFISFLFQQAEVSTFASTITGTCKASHPTPRSLRTL